MLDTPCAVLSPLVVRESAREHPAQTKKPAKIAGKIALT
jgi:hypothetical protein